MRIGANAVRALLLLAMAVPVVAGCEHDAGTADRPRPATTRTQTPAAGTTGTDAAEPMDAGTDPRTAPATSEGTALLERVRVGRHEGFDRVVFEFRNHVPGYRIEYVSPPLREDGSGNVVRVEGDAFLVVRMEPASGFDFEVPEGEQVYTGPRRLSGAGAGTTVVREVVRTGDFEAVLTWAVGLREETGFRVLTLANPARLVIDVGAP